MGTAAVDSADVATCDDRSARHSGITEIARGSAVCRRACRFGHRYVVARRHRPRFDRASTGIRIEHRARHNDGVTGLCDRHRIRFAFATGRIGVYCYASPVGRTGRRRGLDVRFVRPRIHASRSGIGRCVSRATIDHWRAWFDHANVRTGGHACDSSHNDLHACHDAINGRHVRLDIQFSRANARTGNHARSSSRDAGEYRVRLDRCPACLTNACGQRSDFVDGHGIRHVRRIGHRCAPTGRDPAGAARRVRRDRNALRRSRSDDCRRSGTCSFGRRLACHRERITGVHRRNDRADACRNHDVHDPARPCRIDGELDRAERVRNSGWRSIAAGSDHVRRGFVHVGA
ncbi:hypothetical protein, partial [Burkholderia stabilis]